MIQHLNKQPFMCSVCKYRSNWQWDVNKHIKTKSAYDTSHKKADVVVMDETGFKNYSKYKVHLVDVEETSRGDRILQPAPAAQDVTDGDETENIVVTPDILYGDQEDRDPGTVAAEQGGNQQLLNCSHCSFSHADRKVIVSHLGSHTGIKPYRCCLCDFVSKWYHIVLMHSRVSYIEEGGTFRLAEDDNQPAPAVPQGPVGDAKTFKCSACPYRCSKACHMEFHMKQHVPREGAIYKCPHCPYYVNMKKTLSRHMKLHEAEGQQQPMESMSYQMPLKTDTKKHTCDCCPYASDNKTQYLYHKQFHRTNKNAPYKCTHCTYWSTHSHLMAQHQRVHRIGEANGMPQHTPDGTPHSGGIQAMTTMVNGTARRMFKCRFCPLTNKRRTNVKFQCVLCSYRCNNTGVLASHMKLHKAENPSLDLNRMKTFCENLNSLTERPVVAKQGVCNTTQSSSSVSSVSKVKPLLRKNTFSYFCDKCPAMFKSHMVLNTHRTYHNSSHLYPCHLCDYRARHKPHLHKHLLVHTAEYAKRQNGFTLAEIRSQDRSKQQASTSTPATSTLSTADQMLLLEEAETRAFWIVARKHLSCTDAAVVRQPSRRPLPLITMWGCTAASVCMPATSATTLPTAPPINLPRCSPVTSAPHRSLNTIALRATLHSMDVRNVSAARTVTILSSFAVNLLKHNKLHEKIPAPEAGEPAAKPTPAMPSVVTASNIQEHTEKPPAEEKHIYVCSRCPYAYHRRDTVANHLRRHGVSDGSACSFCDYRAAHVSTPAWTMSSVTSSQLGTTKPQAFMKCDTFEVWSSDGDSARSLLFRDGGSGSYFPEQVEKLDDEEVSSLSPMPSSSTSSSPSTTSSASSFKEELPEVSIKQEMDDVVAASKETLDDLVSNVVVLNDTKDDLLPNCNTQVFNIVVLDNSERNTDGQRGSEIHGTTDVHEAVHLEGREESDEREEHLESPSKGQDFKDELVENDLGGVDENESLACKALDEEKLVENKGGCGEQQETQYISETAMTEDPSLLVDGNADVVDDSCRNDDKPEDVRQACKSGTVKAMENHALSDASVEDHSRDQLPAYSNVAELQSNVTDASGDFIEFEEVEVFRKDSEDFSQVELEACSTSKEFEHLDEASQDSAKEVEYGKYEDQPVQCFTKEAELAGDLKDSAQGFFEEDKPVDKSHRPLPGFFSEDGLAGDLNMGVFVKEVAGTNPDQLSCALVMWRRLPANPSNLYRTLLRRNRNPEQLAKDLVDEDLPVGDLGQVEEEVVSEEDHAENLEQQVLECLHHRTRGLEQLEQEVTSQDELAGDCGHAVEEVVEEPAGNNPVGNLAKAEGRAEDFGQALQGLVKEARPAEDSDILVQKHIVEEVRPIKDFDIPAQKHVIEEPVKSWKRDDSSSPSKVAGLQTFKELEVPADLTKLQGDATQLAIFQVQCEHSSVTDSSGVHSCRILLIVLFQHECSQSMAAVQVHQLKAGINFWYKLLQIVLTWFCMYTLCH
ncbi:hypothetical protein HPB47_006197 [Ixodes persulcatus]|uniref:Uncharacterized protein n=1 Tax=Ixodes persulcatus TaxID=34615 RepID=A0AC60PB18_IXOPE|nr:hypothetical protein HPB47_006197 [Ixodes persulcatus]